eukprot:TRINITY_DN108259_c0_g1_i1.p1 TRINITY_DN108259_c0_g1~~TRINITY_DN108259_c0_g1_i1.p1  ORF type:complete len:727 (-),score=134.62 TRINITY_DN108259_c0_g1_i1:30-1916(-)
MHATSQELKSVVERLSEQVGLAAKEADAGPTEDAEVFNFLASQAIPSERADAADAAELVADSTDLPVKSNGNSEHREDESRTNSVFLSPDMETQNTDVFMKRLPGKKAEGKYLFNPTWNGKMTWDFFVMFLVVMDAFLLPFQISFKHGMETDDFDLVWFWITLVAFGTDIFCTFNTAIELDEDGTPDSVLRDRKLIAIAYLKGWFILDFSSTVPWGELANILTGGQGGGGGAAKLMKILKFLRIMRLMRMLRMAKLKAIWESIETYMASVVFVQTVMLLKVFVTVVAICHWSACIFWIIGSPSSLITDLLPKDVADSFAALPHWTTVPRITYPGQEPWSFSEIPYQEQYLFCFYWSLGVMRTMPAEVTPVNIVERLFVLFFMFFALSAFALSMGLLTQAYFKIAERSRGFVAEMFAVRMHLKRIELDRSVERQAKSYLVHLFDRRRVMAKESGLLDKLPPNLKQEIKDAQTIKQMQALGSKLDDVGSRELKEICKSSHVYDRLPGDIVCVEGCLADAAWILVEGRCQSEAKNASRIVLRSPSIIDEDCLETAEETVSAFTVTTVTCCEMLRVEKEAFVKYTLLGFKVQKDSIRPHSLAIGVPAMGTDRHSIGDHDNAAAAATAAGLAG